MLIDLALVGIIVAVVMTTAAFFAVRRGGKLPVEDRPEKPRHKTYFIGCPNPECGELGFTSDDYEEISSRLGTTITAENCGHEWVAHLSDVGIVTPCCARFQTLYISDNCASCGGALPPR